MSDWLERKRPQTVLGFIMKIKVNHFVFINSEKVNHVRSNTSNALLKPLTTVH